jgi:hypothetical protein
MVYISNTEKEPTQIKHDLKVKGIHPVTSV